MVKSLSQVFQTHSSPETKTYSCTSASSDTTQKCYLYLTVGIVTTARLTDATPAALYARTYDASWECDGKFRGSLGNFDESPPNGTHDIAWQFVNSPPGNRVKVALGGGYPAFYPVEMRDELEEEV